MSQATSAAELLTVEQMKQLMWLPLPSIQGEVTRTIKQASFVAAESLPWLDSASVPTLIDKTQGSCPNCAVYREKRVVQWSIGAEEFGHYRKFPFDVHSVNLTLSVSEADLYSCETALRGAGWSLGKLPSTTGEAGIAAWTKFLLPPTHEWIVLDEWIVFDEWIVSSVLTSGHVEDHVALREVERPRHVAALLGGPAAHAHADDLGQLLVVVDADAVDHRQFATRLGDLVRPLGR